MEGTLSQLFRQKEFSVCILWLVISVVISGIAWLKLPLPSVQLALSCVGATCPVVMADCPDGWSVHSWLMKHSHTMLSPERVLLSSILSFRLSSILCVPVFCIPFKFLVCRSKGRCPKSGRHINKYSFDIFYNKVYIIL